MLLLLTAQALPNIVLVVQHHETALPFPLYCQARILIAHPTIICSSCKEVMIMASTLGTEILSKVIRYYITCWWPYFIALAA